MPFDPTRAFHNALPDADPNKENFIQLSIHHRYSKEPPAKGAGFIWWDTSDPSNEKLRAYTGSGWVDLFEHMESTPVSPSGGAVSWQGFVKDKDLTDPPGSPSTGDRYIVAAAATGDWVGEEDSIAEWNGSAWVFSVPDGGWVVWVEDEGEIYVFNGSSWGQESFGPHAATHVGAGTDLLPPYAQVFYVGKHGNDSYDGKHPDRPFLTFSAAITAASGQTPSTTNRFVLVCQDAGIYAESVELAAFISVYAPDATVSQMRLYDQCYVTIGRIVQPSSTSYCVWGVGGGTAYLRARYIETPGAAGGADAIIVVTGQILHLILDVDEISVSSVGDGIVADGGSVTGRVGRIKVEDGNAIWPAAGGLLINLTVGEIEITGTGTGVYSGSNGNLQVTVERIFDAGSGTGIFAAGGGTRVFAGLINCDTAYSVAAGEELHLIVGELTGTETIGAGGLAQVLKARHGFEQNVLITDGLTPYVETESGSYIIVGYLLFPGTDNISIPPNAATWIIQTTGDAEADVRLFDQRFFNTIAELSGQTAALGTPDPVTDTSLLDLPASETVFQIQIAKSAGVGGDKVRIAGFNLSRR